MNDRPLIFGPPRRQGGATRAREVKDWVRQAAAVPDDVTIVVSELACSEPGCPPFEVVMALLPEGQPPVQRKLHKRIAELSRDEVDGLWRPNKQE